MRNATTQPPISVLIADDEPLARAFLRRLVAREADFDIAAEAADGREALAALHLRAPEVAFLDIRMPYFDGVEAAREAANDSTVVVFVTAYDEHAIEAYEAGGIDYLLKPLDVPRFEKMLERVRSEVRRRRLEKKAYEHDPGEEVTLRVRVGKDIRFVRPGDIVWAQAANQYVTLHLIAGSSILAAYSLNELHQKLDKRDFYRVHRSAVVHRKHIEAIRADGRRGLHLIMRGGQHIQVSRRFRHDLSRLA